MRITATLLLVLVIVCTLAAPAAAQALSWRAADATGRAAWAQVLAAEPDLSADARAARFDPRRGLRQIVADLDGDGRMELLLSPRLDSWCGSAGCVVFILRRAAPERWAILCRTYAQHGVRGGDIQLLPRGASGWRDIDATSRVTWQRAPDGSLTCEEAERPRRRR